jgi:ABC-type Zn uptake system ZnuABC Zn-binding protein ZnuA
MRHGFLAGLLLCLMLPAASSLAQNNPLQVVATTTIIADVARNVGGELVQVTPLVPPDSDVHAFQPAPADAALLANADMVLVNGAGLEAFLGDLIENAASARIIVVSNGVQVIASGEHDHPEDDPAMHDMAMSGTEAGGGVSAAYMTITNNGTTADTLLSVTTDAAATATLHETRIENDMAMMHQVEGGLEIPAGGTVVLEPVGLHVMLEDIQRDLITGTVDLTLNFASGTSVTIAAVIGDTPPAEITSVEANGLTVSGAWVRPAAAPAQTVHDHAAVEYIGILGEDADCGDVTEENTEGHEAEGEAHEHSFCDPHFWTDPHNVMIWADNIAAAFAEVDPANAEVYRENAETYKAQLEAVDSEIEQLLSSIPAEKRVLVTNHEFLAYFAARYDFEIVGVVLPGGTTLAEPDPQTLAALITILNEENVPAIIAEVSDPGRLAQVVAGEAGRDITIVTVYSDSLSAPEGSAPTYLDYLRYNAGVIADALGGT